MAVEIRPPEPPRGSKRGGLFSIFSSSNEKAVLADIKKTTVLLDRKERTLSEHEKVLNALDAKITRREHELKQYAKKLEAQEQDASQQQRSLMDREARVKESEAEKARIINERDELEREIQKVSLAVLKQREQLEQDAEKAKQKAQEERKKRQDELKELDDDVADKKKALAGVQRDIERQILRLREEKAELSKQLDEAAKQRTAEYDKGKQAAIKRFGPLIEAKRKELAQTQSDIDSRLKEFRQEKAELSKQLDDAAAQRNSDFEEKKREISMKYDSVITDKRKELAAVQKGIDAELARLKEEKAAAVAAKKKELASVEEEIAAELKTLKEAKARMLDDMEDASKARTADWEKTKQEQVKKYESIIAEKRRELQDTQAQADKQLDRIKESQSSISKQMKLQETVHKELADAQQALEENELTLEKREEALAVGLKELDAKKKDLDRREKAMAQQEVSVIKHVDEMKGLRDQLGQERQELKQITDGKKAELSDLQKEWQAGFTALQSMVKDIRGERNKAESIITKDMVAITDKEKRITQSLKEVDKDSTKLQKQEDAITRRIHELEKSEAEFDRTKKIFDRKIDDFEQREKDLREREDLVTRGMRDMEEAKAKLDHSYDRIKRAKELRQNINLLESKELELQDSIDKLSKKLIVMGHKMPLEVKAHQKAAEKAAVSIPKPAGPMSPMPQKEKHEVIHDPRIMLNQARVAFEAGQYKEATQLLSKADKLASRMKKGDEKRDISYDIWDLRTSLRLVTLS
jgi:chromosome segregation ATPase